MATTFEDVLVSSLSEDMQKTEKIPFPVALHVADEYENLNLIFKASKYRFPSTGAVFQSLGGHIAIVQKIIFTSPKIDWYVESKLLRIKHIVYS